MIPAAFEYLAGPVVMYPNEYYQKVGPKGMSEKPVGSGPYKVVEHQPGRQVKMQRNAEFAPVVAQIYPGPQNVQPPVSDETPAVAAYLPALHATQLVRAFSYVPAAH